MIRTGSVSQGTCQSAGWAILQAAGGIWKVPTNCGTWRCSYCQRRNQNRFKLIVEYGSRILGPCYFITVTLRNRDDSELKDAPYVRKAWKELRRRLMRQSRYKKMEWLMVPEVTKRLQSHLHLIVGGIGQRQARCEDDPDFTEDWVQEECRYDCLTHEWSAAWLGITGDSFVCFGTNVIGGLGAGGYLAKYLTKQSEYRDSLEAIGWAHRYSTSRGWPRGRAGYRGTVEGLWRRVDMVSKYREGTATGAKLLEVKEAPLGGHFYFDRVGDPTYLDFENLIKRRNLMKVLGGFNASFRETVVIGESE